MHRWRWAMGPLVLALMACTAGAVRADRVPSEKTVMPRDPGMRGDITVPYLTTGYSTLMTGQYVAPLIYSSPNLGTNNPQARPVFNLPFYGGTRWLGSGNDGAFSRPKPPVPY
jgi:hypothetical protein